MDDWLELGPLRGLIGTWEGDEGLDVAFSHSLGKVHETPYRERATYNPFGPVDNGSQVLYGLDYRSSMWKDDQDDPFHTEVGYWLWDAAAGQVMKGFVVPRGITTLAGGSARPTDRSFSMRADDGSDTYDIGQNRYLAERARTVSYEVTVTCGEDGSLTYVQDTILAMAEIDGPFHHSDRNTLHRVD